jgi:hypothetical protein
MRGISMGFNSCLTDAGLIFTFAASSLLVVFGSLIETRRCTGTNRQGEPCGRSPIPGGTVCVNHGGAAPQTIAAARQRLLEGVEPAIVRLLKFIETPPGLCATCGRSDDTSAIVSAIRTLLDRAGLGPTTTLEVDDKRAESRRRAEIDAMDDAQLVAHLEQLTASARRLPAATTNANANAVDAEVIQVGSTSEGTQP